MAAKKYKKRKHSRTVDLRRQMEQEQLAEEKKRAGKRMDPAARALLYGDLVFLAIFSILEYQGLVSKPVSALCTVLGLIALIAALWLQFGSKKGRGGVGKGPRL